MSCKSFSICVVLNILDVTCPGVWICPKGMIYLDIWLFGCNNSTSYVEPKFPLVFNEKFNFHKTFAELSNLRDIQKVLEEKCMRIALVQAYKKKQVTLATYSSYVDEVLYPERSRLSKNGELALLMKNEPLFPTNNNITDLESRSKKSCKHCEDVNGSKINEHIKETSDRKIIKESLNLKHKSLDNDECKNTGITSNKFRKNIKAKFNVGAHHYKCCKSKLNNSSSTIESINTSDEDPKYEEKNTNIPVILEKSDEEPKKINPKIKARLHLDVYSCKCGMPGCMLSPSWRNICNEINRKDTVGDAVKYQISLRNYYKRLYEETTNQLGRNLQLL
ncbi:uncharacterized protein LOC113554075 isoform X2 [Rhopalosiphum maidis]|uniref:uncharacterized protein LOC113554075 isoform X2 n=1 Tax=Rhopalosiphum maidis TaxID=43146 RepID=UPI000EFEF244|nr:uncharacterized protein LOC113554075 isoform X2 [Rhopalosiphum maidis]